ncbi:MAG: YdcF family protein [Clostridiales bacterium]|nr:YdcF family protein [Clostridiales bacterium]
MKHFTLLKLLLICVLLGVFFYLGVVAMVCYREKHVGPVGEYDAIIVLGAQVKPDGTPSLQLQWRIDAAAKAWKEHPGLVVVCGAQGGKEPAPEAHIMRDELVKQGVPAESILMDDKSFNTKQNIDNALRLLAGHEVDQVLIVTSDYHLPRAMAIAEDAGLEASGLGSPTKLGINFWVKNHGREALAWIKYWMQKYLHLSLE